MSTDAKQQIFDLANEGGRSTEKRSLRPRLAATLILIKGADAPAVLMGRRAKKHAFMPSKFVFPGGAVDRADSFGPADGPLAAADQSRLETWLNASRARAAPLAAIRETAEETGLLFGRATTPDRDSKAPQWEAFRSHGLAPASSRLTLLARAITPPKRPRRFDTWFFLARAEDADLTQAGVQTAELSDVDWYPLKDALDLDIPIVTKFMLEELQTRLGAPDAERKPPYLHFRHGRPLLEHL